MTRKRTYKAPPTAEQEKWPSVTTIVDLYPKPKLVDAAARVVADGIANELANRWEEYANNKAMTIAMAAGSHSLHRKEWAKAKTLGTIVHGMIEEYLMTGGETTYPPDERAIKAFQGFLAWEKEVDLRPIAVEEMVYGDRYAGRLDLVAKVSGKVTVIDTKVARGFWPTMGFQLAAYYAAWGESIPLDDDRQPESGGILLIHPQDGSPKWQPVSSEEYNRDLCVFEGLRDLWWTLNDYDMLP